MRKPGRSLRALARCCLYAIGVLCFFSLFFLSGSSSVYGQSCGQEVEPNDRPDTANLLPSSLCVTGELMPPDERADWFAWSLSDAEAEQRWHITLVGPDDEPLNLRLQDSGGALLSAFATDENGVVSLYGVVLPGGDYRLGVLGKPSDEALGYTLSVQADGEREIRVGGRAQRQLCDRRSDRSCRPR